MGCPLAFLSTVQGISAHWGSVLGGRRGDGKAFQKPAFFALPIASQGIGEIEVDGQVEPVADGVAQSERSSFQRLHGPVIR